MRCIGLNTHMSMHGFRNSMITFLISAISAARQWHIELVPVITTVSNISEIYWKRRLLSNYTPFCDPALKSRITSQDENKEGAFDWIRYALVSVFPYIPANADPKRFEFAYSRGNALQFSVISAHSYTLSITISSNYHKRILYYSLSLSLSVS